LGLIFSHLSDLSSPFWLSDGTNLGIQGAFGAMAGWFLNTTHVGKADNTN